jgi:hypothetical protein
MWRATAVVYLPFERHNHTRCAVRATRVLALLALLGIFSIAPAQQSIFTALIGEWNHLNTGQSIDIRQNGDVWATDRPLARVSGDTIEGGGNFAFEGKDSSGSNYRCVYYITFLAGSSMSNWRVVAHSGDIMCLDGLYGKVEKNALPVNPPPPPSLGTPPKSPPSPISKPNTLPSPPPPPSESKALASPPTAPDITDPIHAVPPAASRPSNSALIQQIKTELKRVGCYTGKIDDKWRDAALRRSIEKFVKYANLSSMPNQPSTDFLDALRNSSQGICPLECAAREMEQDGHCIVKTCPMGEVLEKDGRCVGTNPIVRSKIKPKTRATRVIKRPNSTQRGSRCFEHGGKTYC